MAIINGIGLAIPTRGTLNVCHPFCNTSPPGFHKGGGNHVCAFTSPPLVTPHLFGYF